MGIVSFNGILLMAVMKFFRPRVMLKTAFICGSSKQGKALRASGASKSVIASHLWNIDESYNSVARTTE
jgi:hypothetical protein